MLWLIQLIQSMLTEKHLKHNTYFIAVMYNTATVFQNVCENCFIHHEKKNQQNIYPQSHTVMAAVRTLLDLYTIYELNNCFMKISHTSITLT